MDLLTIQQIKKSIEYKNLPNNISKSKLNKKDLLIAIQNNKSNKMSEGRGEEKSNNLLSFNNNKYLVIEIFSKMANIYKILGDRFRSEAYIKAIRSLRHIDDIPDNLKNLMKIPGIGKGIGEKIIEISTTGNLNKLKTLQNDNSIQSILQLSRIAGVGPKMAKKLQKMKINSIQQLRKLVQNGEFNLTNQQELGLKYFEDLNTKIPRKEIYDFDKELQIIVKSINPNLSAEIMGSYKRGKSESGDIDVLLSHKNIMTKDEMKEDYISEIAEGIKKRYKHVGTLAHGKFKHMSLYQLDKIIRHIDLIFIVGDSLPTGLSYFTGSVHYNMKMRERAKQMGYRLNEYSLKDENGKPMKVKSERHLHDILGLQYVEPENR